MEIFSINKIMTWSIPAQKKNVCKCSNNLHILDAIMVCLIHISYLLVIETQNSFVFIFSWCYICNSAGLLRGYIVRDLCWQRKPIWKSIQKLSTTFSMYRCQQFFIGKYLHHPKSWEHLSIQFNPVTDF